MTFQKMSAKILQGSRWLVEWFGTVFYRNMLKRNTLRPMQRIIREPDPDRKRRLLRDWAQSKSNESSYIQLAGGFLFTTVASAVQWPGAANGHWSATALLYASMAIALAAIVMGSQQLLVLPNEKRSEPRAFTGSSVDALPQQVLLKPVDRVETEMEESEKQHLRAITDRICATPDDEPVYFQVLALQVPIMLLTAAVVAFMAAMCSIIFAPLALHPAWDDNAKIALIFTMTAISCVAIFFITTSIVHGLFKIKDSH